MRLLKWIGVAFGAIVAVLVVIGVVLYILGTLRLNQTYNVQVSSFAAPTDTGSIDRGQHLVESIGACQDCHGENLGGQVLDDDPIFGRLVASNLTSGQGGIGGRYTDADYVRAIRHGVRPNSKALILMPAQIYYHYSDTDLGAVIAYLKTLAPVNNELPISTMGPGGRIFTALGQVPAEFVPASVINHTAPRPSSPSPAVTAAYGEYLGHICADCHGPGLAGAAQGDPDALPAPNLTRSTQQWSESDFIRAIRSGVTPDGQEMDPEQMPWRRFGKMTDDELRSIWLYVRAQPVQ